MPAGLGAVEPAAVEPAAAVLEGWLVAVLAAGLPNSPPAAGAGWVAGAAVVVLLGALVSVDLAPPRPAKRPPAGAAAGVDDGAADEVDPPIAGKRDFPAVAEDVAGVVEDWAVDAGAFKENAGLLAESVPEEGAGNKEDPCVDGAAPAPPNKGFDAGAVDDVGVVDSAGLF